MKAPFSSSLRLRPNLRTLIPTLFFSLSLAGCAASGLKTNDNPASGVSNWTAIKLIDLPGQPVITKGDASDGSATLVTIQKEGVTRYFRIDRKSSALASVSPFDVEAPPAREINSYARDVQKKIMYDQYVDVWRCRYSDSWRSVAGRDLREEGPLLLDVQAFNPILQDFRLLIAIQSSTFEVVGLSGVSGVESRDEPYYTSSVHGLNHVFGLTSRSTTLNENFGNACAEAYFQRLPAYKRSLDTYEACAISPDEESALSQSAERIARVEKRILKDTAIRDFTAQEFDGRPSRKYNPPFDLSKIETLIQTARGGFGVGL